MSLSSIAVITLANGPNNEYKQACWCSSIVWYFLETNKRQNLMRRRPSIVHILNPQTRSMPLDENKVDIYVRGICNTLKVVEYSITSIHSTC